jgi:tetratricopeptide (TPR) repeat protein
MAEGALEIEEIAPVARVTALEVLALCQMRQDKDYDSALAALTEAAGLEGVDWAQPGIQMMLGDCQRFTGQFQKALESYQAVIGMENTSKDMKAVAHLNLGLTHQYSLYEHDKAKAAYGKAVELKPSLKGEVDGHMAKMP